MADSQTAKDLSPDTWIGLSFPLGRATDGSLFSRTKTLEEQAKHNLKNLLLTHVGERVGQPTFGSRLRALCFEQLDESLPERLEEEIRQSVSIWLPYINIIDVATLTEEGDKNKIFVRMKYSTTLNSQTVQQIELDTSYTATIQ